MTRPVLKAPRVAVEDADAFIREAAAHPLFDREREIVIARAPGRLDLMGGIADYSGSLVLQWPLQEAALAAVQSDASSALRVVSLGEPDRSFDATLADLFPGGSPLSYEAGRDWFASRGESRWAAYVLGALLVLSRERNTRVAAGVRILIRSFVPEGKGVSSSAALEVAVMQSLGALLGVELSARECALLSQIVENRVVGAACGVMDQMTAACGEENKLLALLCQPCELRDPLNLPRDLEIFGLDSGVRHSVSGSDYTSVRIGAFMGARILGVDEDHWNGHLANVTPSQLEERLTRDSIPERMRGDVFASRYGTTRDTVTTPKADREYAVRAPTAHPVHEHFRVRSFASLLTGSITDHACSLLGELMYQSHASYSSCGLGSSATDSIVNVVREAHSLGFLGAKITGGGSGGTVAVLARRGAPIEALVDMCARKTGHEPRVFAGSSPGATAFGVVRLGASTS